MFGVIVILSLVWIALLSEFDAGTAALGIAAALVAASIQRVLIPVHGRPLVCVLRHPLRTVFFVATLAWRFASSTLLTAWLILRGRAESRLVAVPMCVTHPFAQFLLLHAITFTPSTSSLLVEGDVLYIHWLQPRGGHGDWRAIKESLERRIAGIFAGGDDADR